ncbi:MAG TPA: YfiR/HmsC family protein [Bacteroidales bacterium]|nr:YfiR/HmsC family protein [Bacteroidales bacterium]HOK74859.1 YfiR/HmsC family protein [Bacteroidales bacterium]HPP92977.1 YfiR/HmsC family protein [Bacteroidales bacterium]
MGGKTSLLKKLILLLFVCMLPVVIFSQTGFDNPTRALYIFDLARYIDFGPGFKDSSSFKIGVLLGDYELIDEMMKLAKTRTRIQDKPVRIAGFKNLESLTHCQVLYVNKNAGFDLKKIKEKIAGQQTMLITEGYEFRESMINFIVVEGKPRFDINEEYIKNEGMSVPESLLLTAIKTKEDWENLYELASKEIEVQKETIRQQLETIEAQRIEIMRQKNLLDSLDHEITIKEKELKEKQKILNTQLSQISRQQGEISAQRQLIIQQQKEVQTQKDTLAAQKAKIDTQLALINQQLSKIEEQEGKIKIQLQTLEKQRLVIYFVIVALILVGVLAYFIFRAYKIKKEANIALEEKNRLIMAQKDEIERQRDIAAAQRDQIAYQKKHITDSIMYAKRIQAALIPSLELFSDKLEHFVLYKPLAIVSGDFYWVSTKDNLQVIIAADCTGHGVPGAFMSMLGVALLNEIVNEKNIFMPDQILNRLREEVIKSLKQVPDEESVKDGMDAAVCTIDFNNHVLYYAGANCPLYLIRGTELIHYRADKMPVAIHYKMQPFTLNTIELQKGDAFYIFSDGYADQFGGPAQKKFMTGKLKETLLEIASKPMLEQGEILDRIFEEWKGDNPQVDDVTLIGVRYN